MKEWLSYYDSINKNNNYAILSEIIQMRVCVLICHIGLVQSKFCIDIIKMGGIDLILLIFKTYNTNNTNESTSNDNNNLLLLQYAASYCLIILCRHVQFKTTTITTTTKTTAPTATATATNTSSANIKSTAVSSGPEKEQLSSYNMISIEKIQRIVETIIPFMKLTRNDVVVMRNSCCALENVLCCSPNNSNHQRHSHYEHDENYLDGTAVLMDHHDSSLFQLCRQIFLNIGGFSILSNIIELHATDAVLQQSARNVLKMAL